MNLCIPVNEDRGLDSSVCAHFGSAPAFMLVDLDSGACRAIPNQNQHHDHGHCSPLASLRGEQIDGVVVGGIGRGALMQLGAARIPVYFAEHATVGETATAFRAGALKLVDLDAACGGHSHGAGHHH